MLIFNVSRGVGRFIEPLEHSARHLAVFFCKKNFETVSLTQCDVTTRQYGDVCGCFLTINQHPLLVRCEQFTRKV